jgi:hypothetical protein
MREAPRQFTRQQFRHFQRQINNAPLHRIGDARFPTQSGRDGLLVNLKARAYPSLCDIEIID